MTFYSPRQVVEKTGFSWDTIRYYERIGLLHQIDRTAGGRRRFTEIDVLWLLLLRCLRDTGMPIAEMLHFVKLTRSGDDTVPERLALLEEHDHRVEKQIARLRADQEQIRRKVRLCRSKLEIQDDNLASDESAGP
ncbi:MerR family transcriptional regulator [Actinacidiphila oryziradicis]|uniref:MerR family transcriptional regulator n=1 Tax=Actinacidiphila oryziradicis TaxID=2571141 RepID=A0A4U0T8E8_9ACTN|nr:MerR family transcriptional regulator [Actinacidiphila oryziradicis]TKA10515.1 MerR family transcriptional regulator [Actinacidiphila oryziradicis]